MPPIAVAVPLIIQGIQAAVAAAPQIEQVVSSAKQMIDALFSAKLISADVQNNLHSWVDAHAALAKAGVVLASWTVESDPQ